MRRRILSCVTAFFILLACIPLGAVQAEATPNTHPNTYVNTGDQRADIIGVALTQVGYREGANNDTKYGVWYGYNNLAWCGIFVAWCANQAGVPTSVLARTGVASPSAYGLTQKPSGYVPISGDLFFAKDYSHVGLVYYVEGDYFYSLEGNTWENGPEGVYIRRHKLSSFVYASPNYQGGGSHTYVKASETAHPHRELYKCSDCGDFYYTGNTTTRTDCTQCIQANCAHSYSVWSKNGDSKHIRTCSSCGKQESASHSWNSGTVTKAATCQSTGSKTQQCTGCGASRTVTLEKTAHSFTAWEWNGEESHIRTCTTCGKEETQIHQLSDQWSSDEKEHWNVCSVCGERAKLAQHIFGEACDSPCELCGYTNTEGHHFSETWQTDESTHWRSCTGCAIQDSFGSHVFSADCDETCDTCGFERQTTHSFETVWQTDDSSHWYACTVCGLQKDIQSHTPSEANREGAMQYCTVCQLQLTSDELHVHAYDQVASDADGHWGSCQCGTVMPREVHTYSVKTGSCSICGYVPEEKKADYSDLLPWALAAAAILLIGIIPITLMLRKKKKH